MLSLEDISIDESSLQGMGGLELVDVEQPDLEEIVVFKVIEDDLEKGVTILLNKLKEKNIDLGGFK